MRYVYMSGINQNLELP